MSSQKAPTPKQEDEEAIKNAAAEKLADIFVAMIDEKNRSND